MKTEPNAPSSPIDVIWDKKDSTTGAWSKAITQHRGLTKIEIFAAMAMQGLLANPNGGMQETNSTTYSPEGISRLALLHADALITALNK